MAEADVRAYAHVTGGGIPGNLVRVLPEHVDAIVDRSTWRPQPIFELIQRKGRIDDAEMESTFNMGVGMFAIVSRRRTPTGRSRSWPPARSTPGQAGEIIAGTGTVQMMGSHTAGLTVMRMQYGSILARQAFPCRRSDP